LRGGKVLMKDSFFCFKRIVKSLPYVALFYVASCDKAKDTAHSFFSDKDSEALSLCISADVSCLDPRMGIDATSSQIIKMLFEGLMYIDERGEVVHAIAKSHDVSKDQKVYTFHLRDCQWSNGMDITAYDFEYSWKSILEPLGKDRSMAAHNFYIIKNVSHYLKGACDLKEVGIRALDAKTLQVELQNPVPYFLEALTNTWFFPVCKMMDQCSYSQKKENEKKIVSSGPFKLKGHKINNEILMQKNPLFWDAENVGLHKISISIIKDTMTRLCLFEKGRIDWLGKPLSGLPLDACAILRKEEKISVSPSLGVYWYFFNTERFPFTNKKMRQAFSLSINRDEITNFVLQSNEKPAQSIVPAAYNLSEKVYFDENHKEEARRLFFEALEELGIKKENLPELTLSYNSDETHQNVAQIIQHQVYSTLGIKLKLRHSDWRSHYLDLKQGDFCIGGMMWHSWIRDPMYVLQTFRFKEDGINMSRWQNEEYRNLLTASEKEISPSIRKKLLSSAHDVLMDEMPVMPVYYTTMAYGKSERLHNAFVLENSMLDLRHAHFGSKKNDAH